MTITLDQYKAGTTLGGLVTLTSLSIPVPLATAPAFSRIEETADGLWAQRGWLTCDWKWTFLTDAQYTALRAKFSNQSGTIHISTFNDSLGWRSYACVYRFQEKPPDVDATRHIGIAVNFVNMIDETP